MGRAVAKVQGIRIVFLRENLGYQVLVDDCSIQFPPGESICMYESVWTGNHGVDARGSTPEVAI